MAVKTKDINFNELDFSQGEIEQNAKGITAIYFDDVTKNDVKATVSMTIENGFLNITKGVDTLKLTNYSGIKYIKTDVQGEGKQQTYNLTDLINEGLIENTNPVTIDAAKFKVTGITKYSDTIDLSVVDDMHLQKKVGKQLVDRISSDKGFTIDGNSGNDSITGSMFSDVLKGGLGNDLINSSKGNDKLTGGKGSDTFVFSSTDGMDTITDADNTDTIQINNVDVNDLRFAKNKNNLEIFYDENYDENNKIVIQNYYAKSKTPKIDTLIVNGNQESISALLNGNNTLTGKGTITGTKEGNDDIKGSNSNDTVKVTAGDNTVEAKGGDDKLYGGTAIDSKTTFIFNVGDGQDTVFSGKGEDTLQFNGVDLSTITFEQGTKSNNKDLIIKYSPEDNVTVKNYYTVDKQGNITGINQTNSIKHIIVNGNNIIVGNPQSILIYGDDNTNNVIYGGDENNHIIGGNKNDTIISGDGNDSLIGSKGNDVLDGGKGNDIYIFNTGDGQDIIPNGEGADTIKFNTAQTLTYSHNMTNNDLVINYGNHDSITLKDYFVSNSHCVTTIQNGNQTNALSDLIYNNLNEIYDYSQGCTISEITSNGGTDNIIFSQNSELTYVRNMPNNDLIIKYNSNSIILKNYFNSNFSTTTINGTQINTLINNNLNKIYDYSQDCTISEITSNGGVDILKFAGNTELKYKKLYSNNNLIIQYGNQQVTIKDYFINNSNSFQYIQIGNNDKILLSSNVTDSGYAIIGTQNEDSIQGTENSDFILALEGNDTIYGNSGNDTISSGAGNDVIDGGTGNNIIVFDSGYGSDTIINGLGTDTIKFNTVQNLSYSRSQESNDLIISYGDNDSITLKDYFVNNSHCVTTIQNGSENPVSLTSLLTIMGTDGDDEIAGTDDDDIMDGGKGNDTIEGYTGNDTIDGGKGNDIYVFNLGDGQDIIPNGEGADTIKFIDVQNITYSRNMTNNDLVINYGDNDSITLKDYFVNNSHCVTTIQNGSETNALSDLIYNNLNEIYDYSQGCTISEITSNGGADVLKFEEGSSTSYRYEKPYYNNDLIIQSTSNTITIKDYFANNSHSLQYIQIGNNDKILLSSNLENKGYGIIGTQDEDFIEGTANNDKILSFGGNDTIYSYEGNDSISGGEGNNLILSEIGNDAVYGDVGNDTIYGGSGYDYISGGSDNDLIFGEGDNDTIYGDDGNDTIYGGDGNDKLYGSEGNDLIFGEAGNDTIGCYYGNDTIDGGEGNNAYVYRKDIAGHSVIINGAGDDTISFLQYANIKFGRNLANNDLILSYGTDSDITLKDYFVNNSHCVTTIKQADQNYSSLFYYLLQSGQTIKGTNGDDNIEGTSNDDIIYGNSGNDSIQGNSGDDSIEGGAGNDTIYGNNGNDTIRGLADNDIIYGGNGNDSITGGNGNDTVYGEAGDDRIAGNGGDDILDGEAGNNEYIYGSEESGNDTIINGTGNDKIRFDSATTLSYSKDINSNDLIITHNSGTIKLQDFFVNSSHSVKTIDNAGTSLNLTEQLNNIEISYSNITNNGDLITGTPFKDIILCGSGNDTVYGGDGNDMLSGGNGNDLIYGESGNDTIFGGNGNDTIDGGEGNDTYIFNIGNGQDTIINGRNGDTIKFNTSVDISYVIDDYDLIIFYSNNDSIVLKNHFINNSHSIANIINGNENITIPRFYNDIYGSELAESINGTKYNDRIYALGGNDTICGNNGDDIIVGGKGNDLIAGGDGDDTYIFSSGDGLDRISNGSGCDTIQFTDKVTLYSIEAEVPNGVNYPTYNYGLIIRYDDSEIILDNYFACGYNHPVKYLDNNGQKLDLLDDVIKKLANQRIGTSDNESINIGSSLLGYINYVDAGGGDDLISGDFHNNDIIVGGTGNDIINGGAGNNLYIFNVGDGIDTIQNNSDYSDANVNDCIKFETPVNLSYEKEIGNNNLIIKYSDSDVIVLENFFTSTSAGTYKHSVKNIINGQEQMSSADLYNDIKTKLANIIIGGGNNDTLNGTNDKDIIEGGTASDKIYGKSGNDSIYGLNGNDTIYSGEGNDIIDGGYGYDIIYGDDGNDTIMGGRNNDTLNGGTGDNIFIFNKGDGIDKIVNSSGEDTIKFNEHVTIKFKKEHNSEDLIISYGENDAIRLNDYFVNNSHSVQKIINNNSQININNNFSEIINLYGTNNDDLIDAPNMKNIIYGKDGNDTIYGGNGNDVIFGGDGAYNNGGATISSQCVGDKIIFGGDGNDRIYCSAYYNTETASYDLSYTNYVEGGNGDDAINASGCSDTIYGGNGNDDLYSTCAGNDYLSGELGNDRYIIQLGSFSKFRTDLSVIEESIEQNSNDTLSVSYNGNNLSLFMDIEINNVGSIISGNNLYITDSSDFGRTDVGIKIIGQFVDNKCIEEITVPYYTTKYTNMDTLNDIRQEVASWLANTDYSSTNDIITSNNSSLINEMQTIFDAAWLIKQN